MTGTTDTKITYREGTHTSETLSKLKDICRYGGWFMKAVMIFLILGIVTVPIGFGALIMLEDTLIANGTALPMPADEMIAFLVAAEAAVIIAAVISYFIVRMLDNVRKFNTPFRDEIVNDLRTVALLLAVYAVATPVIAAVAAYIMDVPSNGGFAFNLSTLFVAFLVYMLSLIFRYGTELQKESDETL